MIIGYRKPGSRRGQALTLPDWCYGLVQEADADRLAATLRQGARREPAWQTVRGQLIRLAHERAHQRRASAA